MTTPDPISRPTRPHPHLRAAAAIGTAVLLATAPTATAQSTGSPDCSQQATGQVRGDCSMGDLTLGSSTLDTGSATTPTLIDATLRAYQERQAQLAADPERRPGINSCSGVITCPVDPELSADRFRASGGRVEQVLYTSRSGATISGHVWAYGAGNQKRPGIVIANGSIAGFEKTYWYLAQSLAKAGFVVLGFDAQGEGDSDQLGEAPDALEDAFAAIPGTGSLAAPATGDSVGGNGLTFFDGHTDAIDFMLSTPSSAYVPRPSRLTGTSHDGKQQRRVAEGRNAAFNPLWELLDPTRIGLTGHSYGAISASYLAQSDPRVSAAVGVDTMCTPVSPSPDEATAILHGNAGFADGSVSTFRGFNPECFGAPDGPAPALRSPVLGIAGDSLLSPLPVGGGMDPGEKAHSSRDLSAAGVPSGQIVLRGATHVDFIDAPGVLPAAPRVRDVTAWYTTAWFLTHLTDDPRGPSMLRSDRWSTTPGAVQDALSLPFRSRIDLRGPKAWNCEDLRVGCAGTIPWHTDGVRPDYGVQTGL